MKVLEKGVIANSNVRIQIEDWSENYPNQHGFADTVVAYPKSKKDRVKMLENSVKKHRYPRFDEEFRCEFLFDSADSAKDAFSKLVHGQKTLSDYINNLVEPEFAECI